MPTGLNDAITSASSMYGVNPSVLSAVAQVENPQQNPLAQSPTGVKGFFQITAATWMSVTKTPYNPSDPSTDPNSSLTPDAQAQAAAKYLGQLDSQFGATDERLVYLAYNAGPGTAQIAQNLINQGVPYDQAAAAAVSQVYPNNAGKLSESLQYPYKVLNAEGRSDAFPPPNLSMLGVTAPTTSGADQSNPFSTTYPDFEAAQTNNVQAAAPLNVNGDDISNDTFSALFPEVIIQDGLQYTPWYDDKGLLVGNPRMRGFVAPVTFQVYLQGQNDEIMYDKTTGKPITLQLNASIKNYNVESKHINHIQRTRTGHLVTLWGMQPDLFSAECTTGVMLNQFGITDLWSIDNVSSDVLQLLTNGFRYVVDSNTGGVTIAVPSPAPDPNTIVAATAKTAPGEAFRVAAQDAFAELLALFKMNGNVWYWNKLFQQGGGLANNNQAGPSAWSPQLGTSSQEASGRNNDVMTKGFVVMKFKNDTYEGYFKSLNWTQDANNPFQWQFNFVFQIERTLQLLEYPRP